MDVPAGEVDELVLKGAGIAKGYWEDLVSTEKAFNNRWLHTGDLARRDEDGYLRLMDRKKRHDYPRRGEHLRTASSKSGGKGQKGTTPGHGRRNRLTI